MTTPSEKNVTDEVHSRASAVAHNSAFDPICGNCGNPLSKHFHEREEYCNEITTGDVFTSDPSSALLADWLMGRHPGLHARLVNQWKCEHGHKPNTQISRRSAERGDNT